MELRVGELFMLGFGGAEVPGWLKTFEKRFGLGGVVLFDYSIAKKAYDNNIFSKPQLTQLCKELHALPSRPLIYIDQEGGRVRRLKDKQGFAPLPSQQVRQSMPEAEKRALLEASYNEMREIGIDFNLSPVIDRHNEANPNIGQIERAYSKSAGEIEKSVLLTDAIARKTKVGICLKHYPGIGDAVVNSHDEIMDLTPYFDAEIETLFRTLTPKTFTNAILLSHAFVKQWDEKYPISISKKAIGELRKALPDTLLITDDLQMQGLQEKHTTAEASIHAIGAGVDILCIGNNLMNEEEAMASIAEKLQEAAAKDTALAANIQAAIGRVSARRRQLSSQP